MLSPPVDDGMDAPPCDALSVRRRTSSTQLSNVLVEFDLTSKLWLEVEGRPSCTQNVQWKDQARGPWNCNMMQSIKLTGRHSTEEKRGKALAEEILQSPAWSITCKTNLEDMENLIVLLAKCLESWTQKIEVNGQPCSWCVGGSLAETIHCRDKDGASSKLRFVACSRVNWVGNSRSKVANTCAKHCSGLRFKNVMMASRFHPEVVVRKCTWLKCCYGKKPFGAPPAIPWVSQCEFQKKIERAAYGLEKRAEGDDGGGDMLEAEEALRPGKTPSPDREQQKAKKKPKLKLKNRPPSSVSSTDKYMLPPPTKPQPHSKLPAGTRLPTKPQPLEHLKTPSLSRQAMGGGKPQPVSSLGRPALYSHKPRSKRSDWPCSEAAITAQVVAQLLTMAERLPESEEDSSDSPRDSPRERGKRGFEGKPGYEEEYYPQEKKARSELGVAMATAVSSRYELADDYLPY